MSKIQKLAVYQFQTLGGRKFNISAENQNLAELEAIKWRDKNAKNCDIAYNFRVD